eukprot:5048099-Pyramimonas_sp.AAC.1
MCTGQTGIHVWRSPQRVKVLWQTIARTFERMPGECLQAWAKELRSSPRRASRELRKGFRQTY